MTSYLQNAALRTNPLRARLFRSKYQRAKLLHGKRLHDKLRRSNLLRPRPIPPAAPDLYPPPRANPYAIGTTFPTMQEAREAILHHTISQNLSYSVSRADATRYIIKCRCSTCPFRLRVTLRKGDGQAVVTVSRPHNCSPEVHKGWRWASSVKYLVAKHKEAFKDKGGRMLVSELRELELKAGNDVSEKQAWRARKAIANEVES
ncbi:predicted protein [Uncinocarpus reesii 1704]|uniref:Transposase MuDR plant domain-containing protein n=1 Tax=Uncinocarpus reesii (strain UAMH 1704) TaxID=336963 RepID=C4JE13_UNCRE|nr:uncharacterized protein UREG_00437 [Uncinocarpus reesii 1704]EEP75591.1 predicted protein [Uncinocarpus reesii 1704]